VLTIPALRGLETILRKHMTTRKQRVAAKRNIKKAAKAAQRKKTIAHLPRKIRTALGKEGAKAAKRK
jgi:ABC-type transport system involved in Fe-S cluster assembly fused permease/ATPase subunit